MQQASKYDRRASRYVRSRPFGKGIKSSTQYGSPGRDGSMTRRRRISERVVSNMSTIARAMHPHLVYMRHWKRERCVELGVQEQRLACTDRPFGPVEL
jgi:hypothetical protein